MAPRATHTTQNEGTPPAKVLAAQRDTSVSAIVTEMLTQLVGGDPSYDDQWAAEEAIMDAGTGMRVGDITWSRDELHQR